MNTLHPRPRAQVRLRAVDDRASRAGPVRRGRASADRAVGVRPPPRRSRRLGGQLPRRRSRAARIDDRRARRDHRPLPQASITPGWSSRWRRPTCSASGVQGRSVHGQRSGRAALRHPEGDAGDRSRRRAGCPDARVLGRSRGAEAVAAKPPLDALARYRDDRLPVRVRPRSWLRDPLRPRAQTQRATGRHLAADRRHALAFIATLDQPEMVGLSPEVAHETMAGLSVYHGVAQAIDAGKLFHIDLNAQQIGRFDQDLRFGSEGIKDAFFLVKLLEESGYDGPRHLLRRSVPRRGLRGRLGLRQRVHATYLALAAKVRRFADDPQIQDALAECGRPPWPTPRSARTPLTPPTRSPPRCSTPRSWPSRATATSTSTNSSSS